MMNQALGMVLQYGLRGPHDDLTLVIGGAIAIVVLVLLGTFFLKALAAVIRAVRGGQKREVSIEESRMVQEIYHGLSRLEERVEAIETIILGVERGRPSP